VRPGYCGRGDGQDDCDPRGDGPGAAQVAADPGERPSGEDERQSAAEHHEENRAVRHQQPAARSIIRSAHLSCILVAGS